MNSVIFSIVLIQPFQICTYPYIAMSIFIRNQYNIAAY